MNLEEFEIMLNDKEFEQHLQTDYNGGMIRYTLTPDTFIIYQNYLRQKTINEIIQ